jgi:hypothetical protein
LDAAEEEQSLLHASVVDADHLVRLVVLLQDAVHAQQLPASLAVGFYTLPVVKSAPLARLRPCGSTAASVLMVVGGSLAEPGVHLLPPRLKFELVVDLIQKPFVVILAQGLQGSENIVSAILAHAHHFRVK